MILDKKVERRLYAEVEFLLHLLQVDFFILFLSLVTLVSNLLKVYRLSCCDNRYECDDKCFVITPFLRKKQSLYAVTSLLSAFIYTLCDPCPTVAK